MEVKGKLIEVFDTQTVKETFRKREFVIEVAENPQYPEFIKFELQQDKCGLVDGLSIGQQVEVSFNLRGRAWTNQKGVKQYFNTLQAWKVKAEQSSQRVEIPAIGQGTNLPDDSMPF